MKISLDKNLFIDSFLQPISRVSEECSINFTDSEIYTLVSDESESTILYCSIISATQLTNPVTLNLQNIKKLIRVFECIDSPIINIEVDDNQSVLKYKSPGLSFKLHLVQDNVIRKSKISLDKVKGLTFDTSFDIKGVKLTEILKGSQFATSDPEKQKGYFFVKDGKVYCELTDNAQQDLDSITYEVTDIIDGEIDKPIPIGISPLRLINLNKPEIITTQVNTTYGILAFKTKTANSKTTYIVPAMTK